MMPDHFYPNFRRFTVNIFAQEIKEERIIKTSGKKCVCAAASWLIFAIGSYTKIFKIKFLS